MALVYPAALLTGELVHPASGYLRLEKPIPHHHVGWWRLYFEKGMAASRQASSDLSTPRGRCRRQGHHRSGRCMLDELKVVWNDQWDVGRRATISFQVSLVQQALQTWNVQ